MFSSLSLKSIEAIIASLCSVPVIQKSAAK